MEFRVKKILNKGQRLKTNCVKIDRRYVNFFKLCKLLFRVTIRSSPIK